MQGEREQEESQLVGERAHPRFDQEVEPREAGCQESSKPGGNDALVPPQLIDGKNQQCPEEWAGLTGHHIWITMEDEGGQGKGPGVAGWVHGIDELSPLHDLPEKLEMGVGIRLPQSGMHQGVDAA